MPRGVYIRTKPKSEAQREACRKLGLRRGKEHPDEIIFDGRQIGEKNGETTE